MPETQPTSQVADLIQQGNTALQSGNAYEARKVFRQATEIQPDNVEAWLGLADSVIPYRDKRTYLQHALELDPSRNDIQTKLTEVEQKLASGEVFSVVHKTESTRQEEAHIVDESPTEGDEATIPLAYCYRHPDRETGLRCTQCNNPICSDCVRPAAVGQLCPDCARERRPPNYQISAGIATLVSLLSVAYSFLLSIAIVFFFGRMAFLGFFLALLLGSAMSNLLVRLLDRVTRSKRGRAMQIAVGLGLGIGALPLLLISQSLVLLIFIVVLIGATIAQLR